MRIRNHYVSQGYLRNWCDATGKIWTYRKLVARESERLWKPFSPAALAYHSHLYVHHAKADEMEEWFDREFESPAEKSLSRAVKEMSLSPEDWRHIYRFAAMHLVRNPVQLLDHLQKMPRWIDESVKALGLDQPITVQKIHSGKALHPLIESSDLFPVKVTPILCKADPHIQIAMGVGRTSWHWAIYLLLKATLEKFSKQKWTIVKPCKGMKWISSDNPVIHRLAIFDGMYTLCAGWGIAGTEIMLPLDAEHLLYSQVGRATNYSKGQRLSEQETQSIRQAAAENAYRYVLASEQDNGVHNLSPRLVSLEEKKLQAEFWEKFDVENTEMEKKYRRSQ
jgi:hypothetical protein